MIVCLEGPDLVGKGTQTKLLQARLGAKVLKFPNRDTYTGKVIYEHLDRYWRAKLYPVLGEPNGSIREDRLDATVFQTLHAVNRLERAEEIKRYQWTNEWLILDRYWPSGVVYGGADGLDEEWLLHIHQSLPQPDFFILLDISMEQLTERLQKMVAAGERKPDRYENDHKVLDRIERYRRLWAERLSDKWRVVSGREAPEVVCQNILRILREGDLHTYLGRAPEPR